MASLRSERALNTGAINGVMTFRTRIHASLVYVCVRGNIIGCTMGAINGIMTSCARINTGAINGVMTFRTRINTGAINGVMTFRTRINTGAINGAPTVNVGDALMRPWRTYAFGTT